MRHVISILLQNESGALARVAGMFANRGYNIESLNVAPTDDESVSCLTLVTTGSEDVIVQIYKQLGKLIDVVAMADLTAGQHIERELGLLKFRVFESALTRMENLVYDFGAKVLDDNPAHYTVEISGSQQRIDALLNSLPTGVTPLAVVRSGPLAIARGPQVLTGEAVA